MASRNARQISLARDASLPTRSSTLRSFSPPEETIDLRAVQCRRHVFARGAIQRDQLIVVLVRATVKRPCE